MFFCDNESSPWNNSAGAAELQLMLQRAHRYGYDHAEGELTEPRPLCGSRGAPQVARLPQISCQNRSFGGFHAALFTESRTRRR